MSIKISTFRWGIGILIFSVCSLSQGYTDLVQASVDPADIFVSQSGAGQGTSCSDSKSVAWFNDPANWGADVGKISAGRRVHLCGTITAGLTIQDSGTPGNPITIKFEDNAKISMDRFIGPYTAGILAMAANNIIIDGGTNGIIETTNNGTGKAYQSDGTGIFVLSQSDNWEIRNLYIGPIYQRLANSSDPNSYGSGINFKFGGSNINIHDNVITDAAGPIGTYNTANTSWSNFSVAHNRILNFKQGIGVGQSQDAGYTGVISNVDIHDNYLNTGNWEGSWTPGPGDDGYHHIGGIHCFGGAASQTFSGLKIYNNTLGPTMAVTYGYLTSAIYLEGNIANPLIVNNLILASGQGSPTNGFIGVKGAGIPVVSNATIANNTIYSPAGGSGIYAWNVTGVNVKNNLIYVVGGIGIDSASDQTEIIQSDYNLFSPTPQFRIKGNTGYSFSQWQANGYDAHGVFNVDPGLNSSYVPVSSSPAVGAGVNLSALFTTDAASTARPNSGPWTIGAFEYCASGNCPPTNPWIGTPPPLTTGDVLPPERIIDWSAAGIPGGIPPWTTICTTIDAGTYGNGSMDVSTVLQSAIDDCSVNHPNQVVYLPAGTYKTTKTIFMNNNVALRGDGPSQTIISYQGAAMVSIGGAEIAFQKRAASSYDNVEWTGFPVASLSGDLSKGSKNFTMSSAAGLAVGDVLRITQLNNFGSDGLNYDNLPCPYCGLFNGEREMGQYVEVAAINGNNIATNMGLFMPYTGNSPQAEAIPASAMIRHAGIENLTLTQTGDLLGDNIFMMGAQYCWVKNVEIKYVGALTGGITLRDSFQNEIRNNYLHDSLGSTDHDHSGILINMYSCSNLIENNIFNNLSEGEIANNVSGGNVIAYNYLRNNLFPQNPNWMIGYPVVNHGPYPVMNLWEGNVGGKINADVQHGGSGYNVMYRCRSEGFENTTQSMAIDAVQIAKNNLNYSVVGCVLGTAGWSDHYEGRVNNDLNLSPPGKFIWVFTESGVDDPRVPQTLIRWGNFDYVTNRVHWDSSEIPGGLNLSQTLPPSLFRSASPSWWTTPWGTPPWPAIGPDVTNGDADPKGYSYKLPAQLCFENLQLANGGVFNPKRCYGESQAVTSGPPVILSQPQNKLVSEGQTATFAIVALGNPTPTYQWKKNGIDIAGATKASVTTLPVTLDDDGAKFSCVVSNASGTVTSHEAVLTVTPSPSETKFLSFKNVFNPMKESLAIRYTLAGSGATLTIYDRQGNEVRPLDANVSGGSEWDGRNSQGQLVASGAYICVLRQGGKIQKKKLVVVK